ncbi:MAG TPA: acyl-CoA thioesterase domain-containing protein, partial [Solirubrobacteraceae bacterium]|nr:acyl-CoA thioesterase domain-containing protein [Solirubrobacteraceae bacterium]
MTTMTDNLFDTDTRVEPAGAHAYAANLTDRWQALGGVPNGGYLLAVALNALAQELPHPDPVVVSATYLRPGAVAPVEIQTETVRAGRRVATGEAR